MPDPVAVQSMFGRIAGRYDTANRVLSGGIDRWWRRRLVQAVRRRQPRDILDLATGSGDVAFALARGLPPGAHITGMDFCLPMLEEAAVKKRRLAPGARIDFRPGDGLAIPAPDASFDVVTISFGLRNMADRARALGEMRRVLRRDGTLFVLEFSQPVRLLAPFYYFYLQRVLPAIAGRLTGEPSAYEYLAGSIAGFPDRPALSAELQAAGFREVTAEALTGGIVALHTGTA